MRAIPHIPPLAATSARVVWRTICTPVVAVLLLLEPVVNFVCGFVLVCGVFAAIAFELSAVGPRFPFLLMLGLSLSFGLLLLTYHALIAALVKD